MKITRFIRASLLLAGVLTASSASAGISGLYVFGDSDSDAGNLAALGVPLANGSDIVSPLVVAGAYNPSGTASNGEVWSQQLSTKLGLGPLTASFTGGTDYAISGAFLSDNPTSPLPSIGAQVDGFIAQPGRADGTALYVIEGGTNDLHVAAQQAAAIIAGGGDPTAMIANFIGQYVADTLGMIGRLKAEGAERFLVWNLPDISRTPVYLATATPGQRASMLAVIQTANAALAASTNGIAGVTILDAYGIIDALSSNPAAYGLSNVTDPCYGGTCDTNTNLYWDGIHLTSRAYGLIADAAYDALKIPEPGALALSLVGLAGLAGRKLRRRT